MKLLVSVRDPDEVEAALEGGADVIDAKEPARGALGPVTADRLREIDQRVPDDVPLSVALGDSRSPAELAESIAALPLHRRRAPLYLKLGLSHVPAGSTIRGLLTKAVHAAALHQAAPLLIVVEYADAESGAHQSEDLPQAAEAAGAAGLLVDTAVKDGRTLFDCWSDDRLRGWVRGVRSAGLSVGMAGSLGLGEVTRVAAFLPDVIGVRGAACVGGRSGTVAATRVRLLRTVLSPGPAPIAAKRHTGGLDSAPHAIPK